MENTINPNQKHRIIPSETTSEWFFIVLACMFWSKDLFGYIYVAADKLLGTGMFFRTIGESLVFIIFAVGGLGYCSKKIRPFDFVFIIGFLLLYFLAPAASFVPALEYENFTTHFLWALPLYLVGVSMDFSKMKSLFRALSIASIVVCAYYNLVFIHGSDYAGSTEFIDDNMVAAYALLLPTMYMIWFTFSELNLKIVSSWINLAAIIIGFFSMLMLGTRGPVVGTVIYIFLYVFFFKLKNHKVSYGILFMIIIYCFVAWADAIFTFLGTVAVNLGFSDRIFSTILSVGLTGDESSDIRRGFYPILIDALRESPIFGYGLFGTYEFINSYPHNIFTEILFSFGYVFGGFILLYGCYSVIKSYKKGGSDDEKGFLFVLIGGGVIGLLFSSLFIITPAFFFFVGFCMQMAFRK